MEASDPQRQEMVTGLKARREVALEQRRLLEVAAQAASRPSRRTISSGSPRSFVMRREARIRRSAAPIFACSSLG